ncbi:hypothetical protein, variant 3 [Aphanomyces invadans]|nr:hypothetical protein, variant 2 [Aphanomyces invadans]XP_008879965.1 hypothetical protein, variant 3 [Aphanomyces invadans]ETV91335.1 hypothetical protein, variant 2 [Aphanomyces invadans]ETV91336.1 hypothetical protein, variant 3 [Aphanomyces invadans]|eukprot:XP_008879964.1 hypothetical protein, variant 2 [Aphanomyces invadans]
MGNHIAVPISTSSALPERLHILKDSGASHVIGHPNLDTTTLPIPSLTFDPSSATPSTDDAVHTHLHDGSAFSNEDAMLLYTSGTTGTPKGVLATQESLYAQVDDVASAWEFSRHDRFVHFLPLHHTHGIVNNLLAPLACGATVDCLAGASAAEIWTKLSDADHPVTVLMAVPSIYMLLLEAFDRMDEASQSKARAGLRQLRVAISGSMACPLPILERWKALTGQPLLERYGMTECGMALGHPLHGNKHMGFVGQPFPSIRARIAQETQELQVQGPTLFKGYWKRDADTKNAWTVDGWFKTGDIAEFDDSKKSYRILGRASVDIIKSAGYKISALEVEHVFLSHPFVVECAVYGTPHDTWGEIVTAVVVLRHPQTRDDMSWVHDFFQGKLAKYKWPRVVHAVESIPKNAMGKVNKKRLPALLDNAKTKPAVRTNNDRL